MSGDRIRLDKWLWAARFYKQRSLAQEAIDGGHVQYEGSRTKPAHDVRLNAKISVKIGDVLREVVVTGLSEKRGSASDAALLYKETDESVANREKAAEVRRLAAMSTPRADHRPEKRERRQFEKFRDRNL